MTSFAKRPIIVECFSLYYVIPERRSRISLNISKYDKINSDFFENKLPFELTTFCLAEYKRKTKVMQLSFNTPPPLPPAGNSSF